MQLLNLPCKHTMKQNQRLAMLFLRLPPKPNFLQTRLFKKHSEDQDGTLSKCFVGNYSLVNAWALNPEGTKS